MQVNRGIVSGLRQIKALRTDPIHGHRLSISTEKVTAMTIRTILVPLDGSTMDASSLAVGGALTQRFKAHMVALYADPDPAEALSGASFAIGGGAYFTDDLLASLQKQADARRSEAKKSFSNWRTVSEIPEVALPGEAVNGSARLMIEVGQTEELTRRYALVSDLVVAALPGKGEIEPALNLEAALFHAGRPVLALPRKPIPLSDQGPILIAWNDSAEAARAVSAALPFLQNAAQVFLLHAGPLAGSDALQAVASYLAWHGIQARGQELGDNDDPEILITEKSVEMGASLLIMGAYTHSRAREFVFGGVTKYMLQNAQVPLLLAH